MSTALAFVDSQLGMKWSSNSDWIAEVGHWLKTAEQLGFLEQLRSRLPKASTRATGSSQVDPNDQRHNHLLQELAPAMVTHYLVGTGWSFDKWEALTGGPEDVDVALYSPAGTRAFLQVKAPDQPGHIKDNRIVRTPAEGDERDAAGNLRDEVKSGGEADWKVCKAVAKAAKVLPKSGNEVKLIAVCPNRRSLSMPSAHGSLISDLIGKTEGEKGKIVTLPKSRLGKFWTTDWRHVSGVVVLDLLLPMHGGAHYGCIVLMNPVATVPALADWFPHAHVCVLEDSTFRWIRGEPSGPPRWLPNGTVLI